MASVEVTARRRRAYTGARSDLVELLPPLGRGLPVLDVGCSNGATGRLIQSALGAPVVGIERDPALAEEARAVLSEVLVGDANDVMHELVDRDFRASAVVFGDVLEHLVDPWSCVVSAEAVMPDGGWIVASVPNVAHIDTFISLLRGTWPRRDRGIHDHSHLRFFARRDLSDLLECGRSSIVQRRRVYRLVERPHSVNRYAHLVGWIWPNVFTFQYHLLVRVPMREAR